MRPPPPYWVVIFASRRSAADDGYAAMSARMEELARASDGYLWHESVRGADGCGLTLSYWRSEADIAAWKARAEHLAAQRAGPRWYDQYEVRVVRVTRACEGPSGRAP